MATGWRLDGGYRRSKVLKVLNFWETSEEHILWETSPVESRVGKAREATTNQGGLQPKERQRAQQNADKFRACARASSASAAARLRDCSPPRLA